MQWGLQCKSIAYPPLRLISLVSRFCRSPWLGRSRTAFFFLVLPLYCYQPIFLHPRAHMLSHATPWTAARQAPLSMDFSRQEYWSGLHFLLPHCLSMETTGKLHRIVRALFKHTLGLPRNKYEVVCEPAGMSPWNLNYCY